MTSIMLNHAVTPFVRTTPKDRPKKKRVRIDVISPIKGRVKMVKIVKVGSLTDIGGGLEGTSLCLPTLLADHASQQPGVVY